MRVISNHIHRLLMVSLLCLSILQYASPQDSIALPQIATQIVNKVDEYMKAAAQIEGFSGSILIALDGKPVISKGYGMAN